MPSKRVLLGMVVAQAITLPLGADEPIMGCAYNAAVIQHEIRAVDDEWRLPLSVNRPDILTEARFQVVLLPPADGRKNWSARVYARFPDPKPLGIPYSFEKLEIRWRDSSALLDWSGGCQGPGRSMFPGQSWTQEWEIPGTEGLDSLERASFSLWGSRN